MTKIFKVLLLIYFTLCTNLYANTNADFDLWLKSFKVYAIEKGISKKTVKLVLGKAIFLPKVLIYDRRQPEFYEDTFTYINKRTNKRKIVKGKEIYKLNQNLIKKVEVEFNVEKELLLALMGIETNFGNYLGKMDIVSSLATLSFDKRRRAFFSKELITLLELVDKKIINPSVLFGSWAGAHGNFQFMPSTIKNYAIDYNKNNKIELKKLDDSIASAANYISKIGWKKNSPCFIEIKLDQKIPNKYLNTSAQKIVNHRKVGFFRSFIKNNQDLNLDDKLTAAIITPDKDIIPNSKDLYPAFLVFKNYELILKWNRSLRFALAVCTLKDKFKNEI